jgi:hypothetical protein
MGSCACPCTMVVCDAVEDGEGIYSNLKTNSTMAHTVAHIELPAPAAPKNLWTAVSAAVKKQLCFVQYRTNDRQLVRAVD